MTKPENYYLASNFSHQSSIGGGVCIHIKSDLECNIIDVTQYCIENVIEVCAAHMKVKNHSITLLRVYRSPCGSFDEFAEQLEILLKYLFKPKSKIILCGDFNVNFLVNSSTAHHMISLCQSYNLFHVVDFPTRITKDSSSAIDNILMDYTRLNTFQVFSLANGLSDHEAQHLCVNNVFGHQTNNNRLVKKGLITKSGVSTFIEMLQNESWDNIINNTDVNESFNLFSNTFLIIFESCFPVRYVTNNVSNNQWVINGIRISCRHKKYLCMVSKITTCSKFKEYCLRYCILLGKVIRKAK
jgi:hypothetical protein